MNFKIFVSVSVKLIPLRSITRCATSYAFSSSNTASFPQAKSGTNYEGNPEPKTLAHTPTTVPVLNMVLILLFA